MNGLIPALTALGQSLKTVIDSGDAARFREYLEGGPLPALGGDLEPAEIIRRALVHVGADPELTRETARLLSVVISQEAEAIRAGQQITPDRRDLLLDCLRLAADLPTHEHLFQSLKKLIDLPKELGREDIWFSLFRALVHQQTDASLESRWLAILESAEIAWTPALKTWLLTAWRGLLWIPPEEEKRRAGEIVDFDRVELGLLVLEATVRDREGGARLLKLALDILTETYPRSTEFWIQAFRHRVTIWPEKLKQILSEMRLIHPVPAEKAVDQAKSVEPELTGIGVKNSMGTPTDARITSGSSGFYEFPPSPQGLKTSQWRTIQPGETASFDLRGSGPWKVELRILKGGRWKTVSASLHRDLVARKRKIIELIEENGRPETRVGGS